MSASTSKPPTSLSRARPSAPSVTNTTATASSPSSSAAPSAAGSLRPKPANLFSSLLSSSSRACRPKPSSSPSVASSPVSVSVSTSVSPYHRAPASTTSTTSTTLHSRATTTTTALGGPTSSTTLCSHPPTHLSNHDTSTNPLPSPPPIIHPHLPPDSQHPLPPSHTQRNSGPTTTTTTAAAATTTTTTTQEAISHARSAVLASIGNLLDRELSSRAALLHSNNTAIEKQERDLVRATEALRRENDKLGRLAETHARKVKEIGNVQNWAEMLEREFLILEETLRIVDEETGSEGSWGGSGSGSDEEGDDGGGESEGDGGEQRVGERDRPGSSRQGGAEGGKGKERMDAEGDVVMGDDGPEMVPLPESPPGGSGWA
ncbi:hypothetical protein VTI74DRAFT_6292 [Chaetomium olivicolor]